MHHQYKNILSSLTSAWYWLRTTLVLLGLSQICLFAYFCIHGLPACLRAIDSQVMESQIADLSQAMSDMQDFKDVVTVRLAKSDKVQVAKK